MPQRSANSPGSGIVAIIPYRPQFVEAAYIYNRTHGKAGIQWPGFLIAARPLRLTLVDFRRTRSGQCAVACSHHTARPADPSQ